VRSSPSPLRSEPAAPNAAGATPDPVGSARGAGRTWWFALLASAVWFEVLWLAARVESHGSLSPEASAAVGLASQLAFTAVEASLGAAAWGALGVRVRWSELAPALLAVSVTEATAVAVTSGQTHLPEAWRVLLAGARAHPAATTDALARAFAAFGALAVLRLALAAQAHAAAARVPFRRALTLVLGFYLAARLVLWWSLDLMQGRSFEPWSTLASCTTAGSA